MRSRRYEATCGATLLAMIVGCIPEAPVPHEREADASLGIDASIYDAGIPTFDAAEGGADAKHDAPAVPAVPTCGALEACGDACVSLKSDSSNCGECGHTCAVGVMCSEGECRDRAVDVAAGGDIGCARYSGGDVWCWGWNQYGQVGTMPLASDPQWDDGTGLLWRYHAPTRVRGLADVAEITLGLRFGCALKRSGAIACWGHNQAG